MGQERKYKMEFHYIDKTLTWMDERNCWCASLIRVASDGSERSETLLTESWQDAVRFLQRYLNTDPILVYIKSDNTPKVASVTSPYNENFRRVN